MVLRGVSLVVGLLVVVCLAATAVLALPQQQLQHGGQPQPLLSININNNVGDHNAELKQSAAGGPLLVPKPAAMSFGSTTVELASSFQFTAATPNYDLTAAFQRYKQLIFDHASSSSSAIRRKNSNNKEEDLVSLTGLQVTVEDNSAPLQHGVSENYTLTIPSSSASSAQLSAKTVWGALRGLETFSQLVAFNFSTRTYQIAYAPIQIQDGPRFAYRGLLVDTSRHFEPLRTLRSVVDSMTHAKLNVLHWHMTDTQSFPLESASFPALWDGAYSPMERFTLDDVASIVEYARQRGVRVMVEFDVPGHAGSWCAGYPEICPSQSCNQPLNPATNKTFEVIAGLLADVTGKASRSGIFFEDFLHLGGDEVDTSCWSQSPAISTWMQQHKFTTDDTYMYFVQRAHDIAIAYQRTPVNWEEVFNHFGTKLDKRTVIHVWLDKQTLARVVAAGYRGILSNNDVWYLDHLGTTWQQFYLNEPFQYITDPKQQALVLGGEVCMWGETVDTSDIFQTIWPRAAAAAERLWSPSSQNDTTEFLPRLERFRCLLNERGFAAAPTNNAQARTAPSGPGSCLSQ
ncbi:Beta-hexosaminidase [Balamuthia mandrillaris]